MTQKEWEEFLDGNVESWYKNKKERNRQEELARETRERRFVLAENVMKKAQRGLRKARDGLGDKFKTVRWAPHVYSRRAAAQVAARKAKVLNWWDRVRGKPGMIRSFNYVPAPPDSRLIDLMFHNGKWVPIPQLSLHLPPSSSSSRSLRTPTPPQVRSRQRAPSLARNRSRPSSSSLNRPRTPSPPPQNRPRPPSPARNQPDQAPFSWQANTRAWEAQLRTQRTPSPRSRNRPRPSSSSLNRPRPPSPARNQAGQAPFPWQANTQAWLAQSRVPNNRRRAVRRSSTRAGSP